MLVYVLEIIKFPLHPRTKGFTPSCFFLLETCQNLRSLLGLVFLVPVQYPSIAARHIGCEIVLSCAADDDYLSNHYN